MKYGIKFFGPSRKDIWWKEDGAYGNKIMSFDDINLAFRWSNKATEKFPHCKYVVEEIGSRNNKRTL